MKTKKSNNLYGKAQPGWDLEFKEFEDEEFKPIRGYDGHYFISNYGKVVSFNRPQPYLLSYWLSSGFLMLTLFRFNSPKAHRVSRLVYTHFVGKLKPNQRVIHKNKIRTDNYYKNLEAVNRSELVKAGGAKKRKNRESDKLKGAEILQFTREGKFLRKYSSMIEAENDLGIDHNAIYGCLNGKQKTAGNFQWRYRVDPNFDDGIFDIPPVINRWTFKLQPVVQYTLEGKFVKEYSSINEAAEFFGIAATSIVLCVKRKLRSTKNYQWRLKKDVIKDGKIMDIEPVIEQSGKAICKFGMDGKFIQEYVSMSQAAREVGVSKENISCRVKRKKGGGYQWRLKEEVVKDGKIMDIEPAEKRRTKYHYPVCQFGMDGTFIREYSSIIEAAEKTNIFKSNILSCAVNKSKSSGGFQWRFKEKVVKDGKILDIPPLKSPALYYFRPVCQFEKDGKFIREYPSIIEAAEKNNINKYNIFLCTVKKSKSCKGFQWRFKKEVVKKDGTIRDIKPVKSISLFNFRAVCQFGLDGKFIREYASMREVAKIMFLYKASIYLCTQKKLQTAAGYQWRFKGDVVKKDGTITDIEPVRPVVPSRYLRAVCQFGLDGKFIREYASIVEVAEIIDDVYKASIYKCAQEKDRTSAGFQWRFKEDVLMKDGKILDIEPAKTFSSRLLGAVCQFELDGKFIREYPSISDAANKTGVYNEAIYKCVQKEQKSTGDFQWRYKDDPEFKNGITDIAPYERKKSRGRKKKKE
ncbi:MAG: HNH endonuclease [Candidatus Aminicenantes bacterium]|nr:MAG: HNH endonuclease [Candidatus Aminicenantes bacterium]